MSEKLKEVEKMIVKVMKKKELTRNAAMDYMLGVATGRLLALWRYDETVPEGKKTKGILQLAGRKQRAPKSPKISTLTAAAPEPAKKKPTKPAKKRARAKKGAAAATESQLEIASE